MMEWEAKAEQVEERFAAIVSSPTFLRPQGGPPSWSRGRIVHDFQDAVQANMGVFERYPNKIEEWIEFRELMVDGRILVDSPFEIKQRAHLDFAGREYVFDHKVLIPSLRQLLKDEAVDVTILDSYGDGAVQTLRDNTTHLDWCIANISQDWGIIHQNLVFSADKVLIRFAEQLLESYELGYVPCGWDGADPCEPESGEYPEPDAGGLILWHPEKDCFLSEASGRDDT